MEVDVPSGVEPAALGRRLRALRLERELQQAEVARRLSVSPAYLSLIENGKRSLKLPLLFRALALYDVGIEEFMGSLSERPVDDALARLLDEPLLRSLDLSEGDVRALGADESVVTTITTLFNLYKNTRSQLDQVTLKMSRRDQGEQLAFDYTPYDEVTDFLEQRQNWFGSLEARAEEISEQMHLGPAPTQRQLVDALAQLGVTARFVDDPSGSVIRRWDEARTEVALSKTMFAQRAKFQLACAIALKVFEQERSCDPILESYRARHVETEPLLKIHLANYFAGALLLPYGAFLHEAQTSRYDVELLARRFSTSYETIAHRLCNLSDPTRRGVPMHFLRVDCAGNISKKYSGSGIRFAHHEGSCPKLAVHLAFLTPSVITKQYSRFPDGSTYFEFAKVVTDPRGGSLARGTTYAIGLGVNARDAKHLAYADELPFADPLKMAVPVGTTCRFCERADCNMRSAPSYKYAFKVDQYVKKDNFFSPVVKLDRS